MKILVAGSNGQVGHELCRLGQLSRHEFICFDRSTLDVCNIDLIRSIIKAHKPNIVINATAYTAVDKAENDRAMAYAVNALAPSKMAKICHEIGAAFLHISTDYVFAGDKTEPYIESDDVCPTGVYGASKLAGEELIAKACTRHIILRTSWVFAEHGNNFVKTMLRIAQSKDTIGVVADQQGAPTSANGIATALLIIADKIATTTDIHWGIYHYSGAPFTSWHGFAKTIFAEAEKRQLLPHAITLNALTTAEYPTPAKRPANSRLSCKKITKHFGIVPDDWLRSLLHILNGL